MGRKQRTSLCKPTQNENWYDIVYPETKMKGFVVLENRDSFVNYDESRPRAETEVGKTYNIPNVTNSNEACDQKQNDMLLLSNMERYMKKKCTHKV